MSTGWGLRAGAFLALGALALHQVTYRLAGESAGLGGHSHSYLPFAAALAAVLMLLACAAFIRALLRALRGMDEQAPPSAAATLPAFAIALVGVFGLQEWIESWVTPGHPAGLAHVAEHIGWTGLGVALLIATCISLLLRGTYAAVASLAQRSRRGRRARPARVVGRVLSSRVTRRPHVLAGNLAGRAPPVAA